MGRKAEKTRWVDRYVTLNIRMKGRQKNELIDYARSKGMSVNELALYALWDFVRNEKGIPSPGSAQFSIPTVGEVVAAYLKGEEVLQPCGQKDCTKKIVELNNMQFCETCNLRIY